MEFLFYLSYNRTMNGNHNILRQLKNNKKLIASIIFVFSVILFFSLSRVIRVLNLPYYTWISGGSYIVLLIFWALSIKDRIIERDVRRYGLVMAILMIFFVVIRSIKWQQNGDYPLMEQLIWYMYYIPRILLPLFLFLISLSIDKKLYSRYQRLIRWLFFLAGIIIVLIMTNSYHQKFFKIIEWQDNYDVVEYQPYVLIIVVWLLFLAGGTVVLLISKSKLPHTNKRIVLPLFVILFYAIYQILYTIDSSRTGVGVVELLVVECVTYVSLIESLIYVGLIPSNSNYQELFESSPIPMIIFDQYGAVLCKSTAAPPLESIDFQQLGNSEQCEIDNSRLRSKQIESGSVLWLDDMTDINTKIKAIEEINQALLQENDLLRDEILLGKKEITLTEKDRIYNAIELAIADKRALVNKMIETLPANEKTQRATLMRVCLIGAFIKRMSNIILLEEMYNNISAIELQNAITESLFSYRLKNQATHSNHYIDFMMSAKLIKLLYAQFEDELEYYLDCAADVEVIWFKKNEQFELIWRFNGDDLDLYLNDERFVEQLELSAVKFESSVVVGSVEKHFYITETATV